MIYFVQEPSDRLIKIGKTIRLSTRLDSLRREFKTELTVLGILDGGRSEEAALHRRFADFLVGREWFKPDPSLIDFISREARPWTEIDDKPIRPTRNVKIDKETVKTAILVAGYRRVKLAAYLNDVLADIVARDFEEAHHEFLKSREKSTL